MTVEWFKLQTPLFVAKDAQDQVLINNDSGSVYTQVMGSMATQLITSLDMKRNNDKVYVEGLLRDNGEFVVNKDTLTRDPEFHDIDF